MDASISLIILACDARLSVIITHPQRPSLVPIELILSHIFGQVGINFMMDLLESNGFDSIMVMVDHGLSKGGILTPCSKTGLSAEKTSRLYIGNAFS